jgi:hypothetical protein
MNILPGTLPVIPYKAEINGTVMNFELVSATSLNRSYLYELPPAPTSQFNILYRNDKLGYGSINTGFFFYFKQGNLQSQDIDFPEKAENNLQQIDVQGINNDDTWLYKLTDQGTISELWTQVESVYTGTLNSQGQSVRPIFSVASRSNDEVTYLFSDGVFGEIPYGLFRAYFRSGNALQYTIDPSEMNGLTSSIQYVSRVGTVETLTFTFSLQTPSNTAQNRESLASIKENAPARYYTQNRMVNGEDYTNFPFTLYNSIIKSKALNRTSIGISRGQDLLDPTGKYSSTNMFAVDGALFFSNTPTTTTFSTLSSVYATEFLSSTLPVLLADSTSVQYYQKYYPWFSGVYPRLNPLQDSSCYWKQTTVSGSQTTGYFYVKDSISTERPIPLGEYSTETMRYISKGAQLKFVSPNKINDISYTGVDKWFDANNRLTTKNTGVTSIWVGVNNVVGDGFNFGTGNLSNGLGPVTLNSFVPSGAFLDKVQDSIIAQFDNTLSNTLVVECLNKIKLNQDFSLAFDNSMLSTQERWSIVQPIPTDSDPTSYFISFVHNSTDNNYTVTIKNVTYTFGSVGEVRFIFDGERRIFDPKTGQIVSDLVNIVKSNGPLPQDTYLNVTGQPTQSDGFIDDYQVIVSSIDSTTGFALNPQFFAELVDGTGVSDESNAVFFMNVNGINQLLPQGTVIYSSTLAEATLSLYEYSPGTVFYCPYALTTTSVTRTDFDATATTALPHNLKDGDVVTITNITQGEYNGTFVISGVTSTTFKYRISSNTVVTPATGTGQLYNRFYVSSIIPGSSPIAYKLTDVTQDYSVEWGRNTISFQYKHNSGNTTRIDPATTNIIDLYLVTQAYYTNYMNWLADTTGQVPLPLPPTINELQQSYGNLDNYKMISDSVVLNSVKFKPLFGAKAESNLQGTIKVIKSPATTASDTQIRSSVLSAMNTYFSIDNWDFGENFYFSELTAYLHAQLGSLISSVILVPANPAQKFGSLYEVRSAPDQIFVNGAGVADITVISALTQANMNR